MSCQGISVASFFLKRKVRVRAEANTTKLMVAEVGVDFFY
jgi:hypothetical protein